MSMNGYIHCPRRKGTPRLDVRICEGCQYKEKCKEYKKWREENAEKE